MGQTRTSNGPQMDGTNLGNAQDSAQPIMEPSDNGEEEGVAKGTTRRGSLTLEEEIGSARSRSRSHYSQTSGPALANVCPHAHVLMNLYLFATNSKTRRALLCPFIFSHCGCLRVAPEWYQPQSNYLRACLPHCQEHPSNLLRQFKPQKETPTSPSRRQTMAKRP